VARASGRVRRRDSAARRGRCTGKSTLPLRPAGPCAALSAAPNRPNPPNQGTASRQRACRTFAVGPPVVRWGVARSPRRAMGRYRAVFRRLNGSNGGPCPPFLGCSDRLVWSNLLQSSAARFASSCVADSGSCSLAMRSPLGINVHSPCVHQSGRFPLAQIHRLGAMFTRHRFTESRPDRPLIPFPWFTELRHEGVPLWPRGGAIGARPGSDRNPAASRPAQGAHSPRRGPRRG